MLAGICAQHVIRPAILQVQKDQQRREKRVSKKAEEVENALKEEEYKLNRLKQTQQALAELPKPPNPSEEGIASAFQQSSGRVLVHLVFFEYHWSLEERKYSWLALTKLLMPTLTKASCLIIHHTSHLQQATRNRPNMHFWNTADE